MIQEEVAQHSLLDNAHRAVEVIIRPPRAEYDPDCISHIVFNSKL